jgi:poly-gamma-glutamate synthesis protein (capsule biosynthesis protein)
MRRTSTIIVFIVVPIYVLSVFVAEVVAPTHTEITPPDTFAITFVGDMMFDRYVRERAEVHGYDAILQGVLPTFARSDIVIGNLEGPITTFTPVSDWREGGPDHYRFTFATTVAETLHNAGFGAVTLANNHIYNFGVEGYSQTTNWLNAFNVGYFGAPHDAYRPWRYASGTVPFVVYAFDSWYARDTDKLTTRIREESNDAFVVVYAHWGDEYEPDPNYGQKELAHSFVDAGADFVVGSHPHVVQTKEQYKGAWIYYSLGNFVFDQYFSDAVQCGAGVTLDFTPQGTYTVEEFFITLNRDGTTETSTCMETVPLEQ